MDDISNLNSVFFPDEFLTCQNNFQNGCNLKTDFVGGKLESSHCIVCLSWDEMILISFWIWLLFENIRTTRMWNWRIQSKSRKSYKSRKTSKSCKTSKSSKTVNLEKLPSVASKWVRWYYPILSMTASIKSLIDFGLHPGPFKDAAYWFVVNTLMMIYI